MIRYIGCTLFLTLTITFGNAQSTVFGPSTSVRTIIQDSNGNIWLASNEGIIHYDGNSFTNITGNLSVHRFFCVIEDRNGNFWFGNYGSGAYYYNARQPDGQGKSFQHFTTKEGLINDRVFTMHEDKIGNIWFGTNAGVSRFDGKSFQNFSTADGLSNDEVTTIMEDKSGRLWFGTRGNTFLYNGKTFTVFTYEGKTITNVWSIIEDKKGNIWLGGNGLWCYNGNTLINLTEHTIRYVYEDKKGNIWTSGVRDKRQGFTLSCFDANSLSDAKPTVNEITQSLNLFGILEASDGSIWFGAFDGVYRCNGNSIKDFKNKHSSK